MGSFNISEEMTFVPSIVCKETKVLEKCNLVIVLSIVGPPLKK